MPYVSAAGVAPIWNPGVDPAGVGVANARREGVTGTYPGGGSRILYPAMGNMASRSASVRGKFRWLMLASHRS